MESEAHYQYPHDNNEKGKLILEQLEQYRENLEQTLVSLLPSQKDLDSIVLQMDEHEFKAQMIFQEYNVNEFMHGLMEHRIKLDKSLEVLLVTDKKNNYADISDMIHKVNVHLEDEIQGGSLPVNRIPKNKRELNEMIKNSTERLPLIETGQPAAELSYSMDLRVSASEERLKNGVTEEDRLTFLQQINQEKESFKDKMRRLRQKEIRRKEQQVMETIAEQGRTRVIHQEQVEERYNQTLADIERRGKQREHQQVEFKEYMKLYNSKKPEYVKIRESYERDVKGVREADAQKILKLRRDRAKPLDYDELNDHMKRYDAQKRIDDFKLREAYGIDNSPSPLRTGELHFQNMLKNKERDENFQLLLRRREASLKYAKEAQKHFVPRARVHGGTESSVTLPKLKSAPQMPPELLKRHRYEIGQRYLEEAIEYQKNHRVSPTQKLKNSKSTTDTKQARPKHKNYLVELKHSKVMNRDHENWENVLESKNERIQDKYDIIRGQIEKKDIEIGLVENLKKCGAGKNIPETEGYYLGSIKAKLALLQEVAQ